MSYNTNIDSLHRVYSIDIRKIDIYNAAYIIFNKATYGFLSINLSFDL